MARDEKKALQKADEKAHTTQFPPLPNAAKGQVVLRLPPEPSGYMTIGHAMAGVINAAYRDMYEGELWLQVRGHQPEEGEEGLLRVVQGRVHLARNTLGPREERLHRTWRSSTCTRGGSSRWAPPTRAPAPPTSSRSSGSEGTACEHRGRVRRGERRGLGGDALAQVQGGRVGDPAQGRPREPRPLAEGPEHPQGDRPPRTRSSGTKYVVWPVYDFEVVVEDKLCGVTHVLRSSEFHVALQDRIRELLGFPAVVVEQFSRFNFKGTPVSKRLLRPLVEEKVVIGLGRPPDAHHRGREEEGHRPRGDTPVHPAGRLREDRAHLRLEPPLRGEQEDTRPHLAEGLLRARPRSSSR